MKKISSMADCGVAVSSAHSPYHVYGSLRALAAPCTLLMEDSFLTAISNTYEVNHG